jgi:hypothetical protein
MFLVGLFMSTPMLTNANEITYSELKIKVLNQVPIMTDAQISEYCKTFIGKKVNWSGRVLDVDKNWFDEYYTVDIDIDDDGYKDVGFEYLTKSHALRLGKNKTYKFAGEIILVLPSSRSIIVDISYSK